MELRAEAGHSFTLIAVGAARGRAPDELLCKEAAMRSLAAIAEARPEWKALVLQGGTCSQPHPTIYPTPIPVRGRNAPASAGLRNAKSSRELCPSVALHVWTNAITSGEPPAAALCYMLRCCVCLCMTAASGRWRRRRGADSGEEPRPRYAIRRARHRRGRQGAVEARH